MRKFGFMLIILILPALACSVFSRLTKGETPMGSPTEVVAVVVPTAMVPPAVVSSETPGSDKPSEDEVPIVPKPTDSSAGPTPAITEVSPTSREEGLPEDLEELFIPYEVAQYQGGVEISVLEFRMFGDVNSDYKEYVGVIMNTGSVDLERMIVYVVGVDDEGTELGHTYNSTTLDIFPIGGKTAFSMNSTGYNIPENTDHLLIKFQGFEKREWRHDTQDYELLSVDSSQEPDSIWGTVFTVSLEFRSNAPYDTWLIHAGAVLYNRDDRVVGACRGENKEERTREFQPGDQGEIELECVFVYGIVDHFEITVEGSQAPES